MTQIQKTAGIVLKVIDFREYDQIMTVLTQCAGRFIQWILHSQPLHRPQTKIYDQFLVYLEKILAFEHLEALEVSFLTLILRNEGLLNEERCCSVCQNLIPTLHIHQGEHFCAQHAPYSSLIFNEEETFTWYEILQSRTFSDLFDMEIPKNLLPKVETLFKSLLC